MGLADLGCVLAVRERQQRLALGAPGGEGGQEGALRADVVIALRPPDAKVREVGEGLEPVAASVGPWVAERRLVEVVHPARQGPAGAADVDHGIARHPPVLEAPAERRHRSGAPSTLIVGTRAIQASSATASSGAPASGPGVSTA